jgi:hypothetical protein
VPITTLRNRLVLIAQWPDAIKDLVRALHKSVAGHHPVFTTLVPFRCCQPPSGKHLLHHPSLVISNPPERVLCHFSCVQRNTYQSYPYPRRLPDCHVQCSKFAWSSLPISVLGSLHRGRDPRRSPHPEVGWLPEGDGKGRYDRVCLLFRWRPHSPRSSTTSYLGSVHD